MSRRRDAASKKLKAQVHGGVTGSSGGVRNTAPLFAALGDETRLRLVAVLCAGAPVSIARLTTGTNISRQAVTKHLHVLAEVGLVRDIKVGRERLWQFEPGQLDEARRALQSIAQQWDFALANLKRAVES